MLSLMRFQFVYTIYITINQHNFSKVSTTSRFYLSPVVNLRVCKNRREYESHEFEKKTPREAFLAILDYSQFINLQCITCSTFRTNRSLIPNSETFGLCKDQQMVVPKNLDAQNSQKREIQLSPC